MQDRDSNIKSICQELQFAAVSTRHHRLLALFTFSTKLIKEVIARISCEIFHVNTYVRVPIGIKSKSFPPNKDIGLSNNLF
jgi:hypothetical protein